MNPFDIDWRSMFEESIPGLRPAEPYMPLKERLTGNYNFWEEQHSPTGVKLTCTSPLGGEIRVDYEKQVIDENIQLYLTKIIIRPAIIPCEKVTPTEISIEPGDSSLGFENYILRLLRNGQITVR